MKHDLSFEISHAHVNDLITRSARRIEMSRAAVQAARAQKLKAAALLQRYYAQSAQEDRQA